ncbi:hypothetical protein [Winogradskyella algicola]|uniref:hypothetical protein n=1 Tax=Winogradskyella algicola TaxID=2575815 RepID=UPI001107CF5B|nr:hypothetical protein [Winogradskyella algicola]
MEDTNNMMVTSVGNDFGVDAKSLANLIAYGTPYKPKPNVAIDRSLLHTLTIENGITVWTENIIEKETIGSGFISLSQLGNYDIFYVSLHESGYMRIYVDPQEFTVNDEVQIWYRRLSLTAGGILIQPEYVPPENITEFSGLDIDGESISAERLYYGATWNTIVYINDITDFNEVIISDGTCSLYYNYEEFKVFNKRTINLDFTDHEGYGAGFIEQWGKGTTDFDRTKTAKDIIKRQMKVILSDRSGSISQLPMIRLSRLNNNQYVLEYKYEEQAMCKIPDSDWAIKLEFQSYQGLLYFLNLYYFNNSPFNTNACRYEALFLNDYDSLLALNLRATTEEQLTILYYLPYDVLINQNPIDLWHILGKALRRKVSNNGLNIEDILLSILRAIVYNLRIKTTYEAFLNALLTKRINNKSYLYLLFDKLNNDRFRTYIHFLWQIWSDSAYSKIDDDNTALTHGGDNAGPIVVPYTSNKTIGIYNTSARDAKYNTDSDEINIELVVDYEDIGTGNYDEFHSVEQAITAKYTFHPFSPLAIINNENPKFIYGTSQEGQFTLLPAIVLLANEESKFWSNLITAGEYAIDIATTLSGVGNILKFRHLAKLSLLQKAVKIGGYIEMTSGTINALLKLSGLNDTKFGQALSEYLFYLELLSLGAELSNAIEKGLKKAAGDVLKHEDDFIKHLDEVEVDAPNGQKRKLTEEEKIKIIEDIGSATDVKPKRQLQYKNFIKKWKGKSIANLSREEIADNLKGFTEQANRVAKIIEDGKMEFYILDEEAFKNKYLQLGGKEGDYKKYKIEAFSSGRENYFRSDKPIEKFMSELVHEGTHTLDNIKMDALIEKAKTLDEMLKIEKQFGNQWSFEKRAYFHERSFQEATGLGTEYKTIEKMLEHIFKVYPKHY